MSETWWAFRFIFLISCCLRVPGEGGAAQHTGRGRVSYWKSLVSQYGGGGGKGAGRVSGIWGGGGAANLFFSGPKCPFKGKGGLWPVSTLG